MELRNKTICFLGDSITQGVGVEREEEIFHCVLKRRTGLAAAKNEGVSGTRYARQHMPPKPGFETADRLPFVARYNQMGVADAVVVFGGTNDFGHGDAPIGAFTDRTADTFYGACHVLYAGLIETYPGKPIVILTPLHRVDEWSETGMPEYKTVKTGVLRRYVEIIREVAAYYALPVLDLYQNSGLEPSIAPIRELYMPDGVHPNARGHAILAHMLEGFLKNL